MKKVFIYFGIIMLFSIAIASGAVESLGTFEKGDCVTLVQTCANCTYNNISMVIVDGDNQTIVLTDAVMTKSGTSYSYNCLNVTSNGDYTVNGYGDPSGSTTIWAYTFKVTTNGRGDPAGSVVVFFTILFIIISIGLLGLLLYTIFKSIEMTVDAKVLIINISAYFGVWVTYILGLEYLGNSFINDMLLWVIEGGSLGFVLLPIIMFVVSYFKQNMPKGDFN